MSSSSTTTEQTSIARADLDRLPIGDDADPQRLRPTHPGRVLREDFLIPLGLSARRLAAALHVPANRITAILNGEEHALEDGSAIVIPAGTEHNIINSSRTEALKLYTIYSPPEHPDATIHETKADAEAYEREHHR